jgi:N-acetylglucosaminyl-diphospho-decaprenol L-rhamnosyltransferase
VPAEVAVQIVNYNTKPYLDRCLAAVERDLDESGLPARVLVIDNDSDDDLSDLQARHPRVSFRASARNIGFGAAQNVLAGEHDARAILMLNPDTELVEPRTIARLMAVLDSGPEVAAVGPKLVGPDGAGQRWDHGELDGAWARLARAAGHSHHRPRAERAEVAWVSGASALVARDRFDAAGGFDPQFFLYKEEEDLFLRIRRAGGRVVYEPAITAVHHGSVSAGRGHHLEASVARYRAKHVHSRVQRAVMPVVHRQAVAWDGRVRRLLRQRTR